MTAETPASPRAVLVAAAVAAIAVIFTAGLGVWQVERLQWKEALLARIDQRIHADPVSLDEIMRRRAAGEDVDYVRVSLSGVYDHADALRYYALGEGGQPGWHIITPLVMPGGAAVLVNRGFVPRERYDEIDRPAGTVSVTGLVRSGESQGLFVPDNEPDGNVWYWRDVPAMLNAAGVAAGAPPIIVEREASSGEGWPKGGATRIDIPNSHLQYAVTWFALSLVGAAIFSLWYRRQRRLRLARTGGEH